MSWKRFLVAADNHGSLVCKDAMKKLLDFAATWKPHYRIHLGDVWDFAPLRRGASQEEKADGIAEDYKEGLRFLDAFKPTHLTLGNHDDRIWMVSTNGADGILRERCADLASASEREFEKRKIQWVPYHVGKSLRLPEGGPRLIHGFRSTMYPAKAHAEHWGECLVGHVHKPDTYAMRHADGGQAFSLGCMADIGALSYADRHAAKLGWRNGFLFGMIHAKTGRWNAWHAIKEGGDWISPHGIL
jgi:predicted phosphodiesterase